MILVYSFGVFFFSCYLPSYGTDHNCLTDAIRFNIYIYINVGQLMVQTWLWNSYSKKTCKYHGTPTHTLCQYPDSLFQHLICALSDGRFNVWCVALGYTVCVVKARGEEGHKRKDNPSHPASVKKLFLKEVLVCLAEALRLTCRRERERDVNRNNLRKRNMPS